MSKNKSSKIKRDRKVDKGFGGGLSFRCVDFSRSHQHLREMEGRSNQETYAAVEFQIVFDLKGRQLIVPAIFHCLEDDDGALAAVFGHKYVSGVSKKTLSAAIEKARGFIHKCIGDFVISTSGVLLCPQCGCCPEHCECDRDDSRSTFFLPRPRATTSAFSFFVLNQQLTDALVHQVQVFDDAFPMGDVETLIVVARSGSTASYTQMEAARKQLGVIRLAHYDFFGTWEETTQGHQLVAAIEAVGAAISAAIEHAEREEGLYGPDEEPSEDYLLVSADLDLGEAD